MYNFLSQNILLSPIYIYHSQKELKHFSLEMSLVYGVLGHFEFKIYKDF